MPTTEREKGDAKMDDFLLINVLFIAAGVIFMGLAMPLILGKVPPNQWYGFRTPKTLSEARIWYPVNRIMGFDLLAVGTATIISAVSILVTGRSISITQAVITNMAVLFTSLILGLIHGFWTLSKY